MIVWYELLKFTKWAQHKNSKEVRNSLFNVHIYHSVVASSIPVLEHESYESKSKFQLKLGLTKYIEPISSFFKTAPFTLYGNPSSFLIETPFLWQNL